MKHYDCDKNCGKCPNHKDCAYWNAWEDLPTIEEEQEEEGYDCY